MAEPRVLPQPLTFRLAERAGSPAELLAAAREALRGSLPEGAAITVHAAEAGASASMWQFRDARAIVQGAVLPELPTARTPEPLPGGEPLARWSADRVRLLADGTVIRGLRFAELSLELHEVRGTVHGLAEGCVAAIVALADGLLRVRIAPADVEALIRSQVPMLQGVAVRFEPEGRFRAQGKLSLGFLAIGGMAEGRLVVERGEQLHLREVRASLANGRPAPAAVTDRLRATGPLLDLSGLRAAGWPLTLGEPEIESECLVLTGAVG